MENFDNSVPTFDRLPAFVLGLSQKIDGIEKKIDMLLSAPKDGLIDRHELLNIKQASELIGKTVGTIYTLTSDNKIPFSKRGNKLYFFKDELLEWIKNGGEMEGTKSAESTSEGFDRHLEAMSKGKRRRPEAVIRKG